MNTTTTPTGTKMTRPTIGALATIMIFACACAGEADIGAAPVEVTQGEPGGGQGATDPVVQPHKPSTTPVDRDLGDGEEVRLQPKPEVKPPDKPVEPEEPAKPEPVDGELGGGKAIGLVPAVQAPTRNRRRMNIDQLDAALRRVSGGIGWTSGKGTKGAAAGKNNFVVLAATLGKPNYTDLTNEDLEPGALFQKFLGDASSSVCAKLSAREATIADADKRVLMRHVAPTDTFSSNPAGVNKNIAWLVLRYHGRKLPADSPQLEPWRFLFQTATKVSKSPATAWRAVCVGLIQHPLFFTW